MKEDRQLNCAHNQTTMIKFSAILEAAESEAIKEELRGFLTRSQLATVTNCNVEDMPAMAPVTLYIFGKIESMGLY